MKIGSFLNLSLTDWKEHLAPIIFTKGCNLRCPWCHNPDLVLPHLYSEGPTIYKIMNIIFQRKDIYTGIVISGGEPTIQDEALIRFLKILKHYTDLSVKLYTNGTRPDVIKCLLSDGLIDCLCVDYKMLLKDYHNIVGCETAVSKWTPQSIVHSLQLTETVDGEIRTTIIPSKVIHTKKYLADMERELSSLVDLAKVEWIKQPFIQPENGTLNDRRAEFAETTG